MWLFGLGGKVEKAHHITPAERRAPPSRRRGAANDLADADRTPSALLRAFQVAELIGSTEAQIRNMRARGQLPAPIKVPGLGVRWRRSDLDLWLAQLGERR